MGRKLSGVILVATGIWWLFGTLDAGWHRHRAQAWEPVPATIISSGIVHFISFERGRSMDYMPAVKYQFTKDGKSYTGDRVRFGYASGRFADASRDVGDFPVGAVRTAYVNPRNPAEAVLDRDRIWRKAPLSEVLAAVGILVGIAIVWFGD